MRLDLEKNRGVVVVGALVALLALGNDVAGAVTGLYDFALTSHGQAVLLVAALLLLGFLTLDKFVRKQ